MQYSKCRYLKHISIPTLPQEGSIMNFIQQNYKLYATYLIMIVQSELQKWVTDMCVLRNTNMYVSKLFFLYCVYKYKYLYHLAISNVIMKLVPPDPNGFSSTFNTPPSP